MYEPPKLIAAQRLYDQRLPPDDPQDVPGEDTAYFLEEMSKLIS